MRNLITIRTIDRILPIEGADAIETAVVGGWTSVVRKDDGFKEGDKVLYCEIDTFLPEGNPTWDHLMRSGVKTVRDPEGREVRGHVLRTVKLRGQVSQGLILRIGFGLNENSTQKEINETFNNLGVMKYEAPLPPGSGSIVGPFDSGVRKTDSERVQNLTDEFLASLDPSEWVATEKIDGTSTTYIKKNGKLHSYSRNWEVDKNSLQARLADHMRIGPEGKTLEEFLPDGVVLQGEIFGPGIQGNPLQVDSVGFAIFSSVGVEEHPEVIEFVQSHKVPELELTLPRTVSEAVRQADNLMSRIVPVRQAEGIVWWNRNTKSYRELGDRPNFKAINNTFLVQQGKKS